MTVSPLAGKLPTSDMLIDLDLLVRNYFEIKPDTNVTAQLVAFGTSGHRGAPSQRTFNEAHILAIAQAICEFRKSKNTSGPLFLAKDTHAADIPAHDTALEVLAANGVEVIIAANDDYTPVPVLSHAILQYNKERSSALADGIAVTPSHNPPKDGGIKYNPPSGRPADTDVTQWIQNRANELLRDDNKDVKRVSLAKALSAPSTRRLNLMLPYVRDLSSVIDMELLASSGIKIGADPLGGASVHLWHYIAEHYKLNLTTVNPLVDYQFPFMSVDHDGQIRMDCSSPYAMAGLVALKDKFQIAFGNDTDADRHGIVAPSVGLLPPNHNLAASIRYLFTSRTKWRKDAMIGKTLVSSSIIDRIAASLNRKVYEVPVGFKWFASGLFDGSLGFVGEESAGATLLRKDGGVWTTDKDGPVMGLLAAEMTAQTGKDPGQHYNEIENEYGRSYYKRQDQPATADEKKALAKLNPSAVKSTSLAGEKIISALTNAPGNGAAIGGLKVTTENGWFAARPSGTEELYKIYAESLRSEEHLEKIIKEAKELVSETLSGAR